MKSPASAVTFVNLFHFILASPSALPKMILQRDGFPLFTEIVQTTVSCEPMGFLLKVLTCTNHQSDIFSRSTVTCWFISFVVFDLFNVAHKESTLDESDGPFPNLQEYNQKDVRQSCLW